MEQKGVKKGLKVDLWRAMADIRLARSDKQWSARRNAQGSWNLPSEQTGKQRRKASKESLAHVWYDVDALGFYFGTLFGTICVSFWC